MRNRTRYGMTRRYNGNGTERRGGMIATIRTEKLWHNHHSGFVTRQMVADLLLLKDGSHIDRIMAGYPVLCLPRKDGKMARMYHKSDVFDVQHKRQQNAPELFDKRTIKATAKDKRKAQQDADIKTMMTHDERWAK
jgi:hypothetical protein